MLLIFFTYSYWAINSVQSALPFGYICMAGLVLKSGEWCLLEVHLPMHPPRSVGVLLRERQSDKLTIKLRPAWWQFLGDGIDAEIWHELAEDLAAKAEELGAEQVIEWLASTASHVIQIGNQTRVQFEDAQKLVDALYTDHVATRTRIRRSAIKHRARVTGNHHRLKLIGRLITFRSALPSNSLMTLCASVSAALAFLLGILIVDYHPGFSRRSQASAQAGASATSVELPPAYDNSYLHMQPRALLVSDLVMSGSRGRSTPHKARFHRRLMPPLTNVPLPVSKVRLELEIRPLELVTQSAALQISLPDAPILPGLPPFKLRHSRLRRTLEIVSNPFRSFLSVFSRRASS